MAREDRRGLLPGNVECDWDDVGKLRDSGESFFDRHSLWLSDT